MKKLTVWSILTICCTGISTSVASETFRGRQKRIINGQKIEQNDYFYDVTNWYVWIGDGHECATPGAWLHHCAKPFNLRCGGSLLTTNIVQTSCECLASFIGPAQRNVTTACVLNHWEKMHILFIASKYVEYMVDGYMSLSFYIHQHCGQLNIEPRYLTTHDFGFIKLRRHIKEEGRDVAVSYAPIYSMKTLGKLWTYNTNSGVVCMATGYGSYEKDETGMPKAEYSTTMRYSWVVIYDYLRCFYMTRVSDQHGQYVDVATWWCMTRIPDPTLKSYLAPGDGGSPLSCNSHYSGIVSAHVHHLALEFTLQFSSAIAFTPYQNAIEFREDFERNMNLLVNDPTFNPTFITVFPLEEQGFKSGNQARSASTIRFLLIAVTSCIFSNLLF